MAHVVLDIADAVATKLNEAVEGTFSESFTAQRLYVPSYNLEDMQDVHVTVIPQSITEVQLDRDANRCDCKVSVVVQRLVASAQDADGIDAMMDLMTEIADYLRFADLSSVPADWTNMEMDPIYSPEHLESDSLFTGMITLTFGVLQR